MGTARRPNSTRARKARSLRPSPKSGLAQREPVTELDTTDADTLREEFAGTGKGPPTPAAMSRALRWVVERLELIESYLIVCRMALDGQGAEQDADVASLLRRPVGDLLFNQIRHLKRLASRREGKPGSNDDEPEGDDSEGRQP